MVKLIASNTGPRTQAIRIAGGLAMIKPGREVEVEPSPELDRDMISHFRSVGVTFRDPVAVPATPKKPATKKQIAAAEKAVLAAMEAIEKADRDLVAKAEAEKALKDAEAALEALKG